MGPATYHRRDTFRPFHALLFIGILLFATAAEASVPDWIRFGPATLLSSNHAGSVVLTVPLESLSAAHTVVAVAASSTQLLGGPARVPDAKSLDLGTIDCKARCTLPPVRMSVASGAMNVPDAPGWTIVDVVIRDTSGNHDEMRHRVFLQDQSDGAPAVRTGEDYVKALNIGTEDEPLFVTTGHRLAPPLELEHVHPLDNPSLAAEDREHIANLLSQAETQLAEKSGALSVPGPAVGSDVERYVPGEVSGCRVMSEKSGFWWLVVPIGALLGVRRRKRTGTFRRTVVVVVGAGIATSAALGSQAQAATCLVFGTGAIWDAVRPDYRSEPGSRRPWCDVTDTSCAISDPDCCFEALPRVSVNLHKGSRSLSSIILTTLSGSGGSFLVWDSNCSTASDYFVSFTFARSGYPASQILTGEYGTTPYTVVYNQPLTLSTAGTNLGQVSINTGGDTVSWAGDLASLWYVSHMTFSVLESEGTTRHRRTRGSSNAYDLIHTRYQASTSGVGTAFCPSEVHIEFGGARAYVMPHELGHILHYRTTGGVSSCPHDLASGTYYYKQMPGFTWGGLPGSPWESEAEWSEAFAHVFGAYLSFFDPRDTNATWNDIHFFCPSQSTNHANDTSNRSPKVQLLWNFIDTDASGDNYEGAVVGVEEILHVMDTWQGNNTTCSGQTVGVNRTLCELYLVPTTHACSTPADCALLGGTLDDWHCGFPGTCYKGDVHGRNLRDLAYHIAQYRGEPESVYIAAITSSPCVGAVDNSYPFQGGYRGD